MENFDINMFFKAGFILFIIKEFYQSIKSGQSELQKNTEALIELKAELKYFMAQVIELASRVKALEAKD